MRLRHLLPCLIAFSPLAASADAESDFIALQTALPDLPVLPLPENPITATKALIAGLAGDWAPFSTLAGGYGLPDPEALAKLCDRMVINIQPVGDLGLTIAMGMGENSSIAHLVFAGSNTFAAVPDEASVIKRLFGDKADEVPEQTRLQAVTRNRFISDVILLPSGENLLLVLAPRYPAEVWSRCP